MPSGGRWEDARTCPQRAEGRGRVVTKGRAAGLSSQSPHWLHGFHPLGSHYPPGAVVGVQGVHLRDMLFINVP